MALDNAAAFRNVDFRPPRFVSHILRYGGFLPDEPGAHACFYYMRMAIISLKAVRDGAQYEGEIDHQQMLNNIARSVAILYRLESPSDFLIFMPYVKAEAMRLELEWDVNAEHPAAENWVKKGN